MLTILKALANLGWNRRVATWMELCTEVLRSGPRTLPCLIFGRSFPQVSFAMHWLIALIAISIVATTGKDWEVFNSFCDTRLCGQKRFTTCFGHWHIYNRFLLSCKLLVLSCQRKCSFLSTCFCLILFVDSLLLLQWCAFQAAPAAPCHANVQVHDCPRVAARQAWWRLGGFALKPRVVFGSPRNP